MAPHSTKEKANAETETQLRMLRPRSAAGERRGAHLHVRVHVLHNLRRRRVRRRLPELQRQPGGSADAAGGDAGEVSGLDRALSARCAVRHAGGGIAHCAASRAGDWAKKIAAFFSAVASVSTSPGLLP